MDVYGADNHNALNWGCTTSRGSVATIVDNARGYVDGASLFLINVGDTGGVTISCRYHYTGSAYIYGISIS